MGVLQDAGAQQELGASVASFRQLVEAASEGVWVISSSAVTTFVNARMAEMLGRAPGEMVGHPLAEFLFEEDLPDNAQRLERRRRGVSEHYERRLRHRDGHAVWALASAAPLFDEEHAFQGSFAMYTDITDRKRDERDLSLLNFALDHVRDAAFLIDVAGRFRFVNEGACRALGWTRDELLRLGVADVDPDFPAGRWPEHWHQIRARGSLVFEGRHRTKDGRVLPVEISANYFEYDGEGYNLALVRDIGERKQAEDEIRRLAGDLERRVAERTAQLEDANQELEAFAYSVSHDLQVPLRHIEGFLQLLQQRAASGLDAQSRHYLEAVAESVRRMGLLIDDILSFSRASRQAPSREPVDLGALAREVIRELAPDAAGRAVEWRVAELPVVQGDRALLRVVLVNLLSNALKFTRPRSPARIEVGCRRNGAEVVLHVRDNGVGFDPAHAHKLFGAFERLHRAEDFEGTGVGLANVRRIVGRHGGRTWADGSVGGGATFYFSLPGEAAIPSAKARGAGDQSGTRS